MEEALQRVWRPVRAPAAIALVLVALALSGAPVVHGRFAMGDFKAFYCSAQVILEREDPYAAAPMARCEAAKAPAPLIVTKSGEIIPAPLPGYVIAAFVPLALLPFAVASMLWFLILVAATILAIALLAKLDMGDPWSITIALAIVVVALCFPVGELPPIALLGIALAAWSAKNDRPVLLGIGVALAFCEPQIGAAAALGAIALQRRFALPAILAVVVLGIVSLAAIGISGNLEYVRVVLPAHLISELPSVLQYSLSWVLYRLGMAVGPALLLGRLSWIGMLGVTIWFARSAFARRHPESVLLAAPAFSVVGGPFLHLDHVALAIPAALWLASAKPSWLRTTAIVALAVPLLYVFSILRMFALLPFVAAWLGSTYGGGAIAGLRTALGAIAVAAVVAVATIATGTGAMVVSSVQPLSSALPQASWAQFVGAHFVMTSWTIWLVKAPVWIGIVATAAQLVAAARSDD